MHHHSPHCCLSMSHHSLPNYHSTGYSSVAPMVYPVPMPYYPSVGYAGYGWGGQARHSMPLPQEVSVDSATSMKEVLIGGTTNASLTLEYAPDAGATSPLVKVTVEIDGSTSTWQETSMTDGYHVKSQLLSMEPGAKVTLEVTEAMARLRWCEIICC
ncbi:MAG: hypothetical protein ABI618_08740 [Nitrospirota bacterium]